MKDNLFLIGKIAGAVMAIISIIGFFAEPFLEDYVNSRIEAKFEELNKDNKESFRALLSKSMGVSEDEIHVRIGDMYKDEGVIKKEIKYYHPTTLLDK